MSLSVGTAWDETAAFAKREAWLFPIAFFLHSLPAAILRLVAPVTASGRVPEGGWWLLFVPVVAGRSARVTTPATGCRERSSASSVGTANSGVPKNTRRSRGRSTICPRESAS